MVKDEVVATPSVLTPAYERDQIVVSGRFDRAEAEELAEALSA